MIINCDVSRMLILSALGLFNASYTVNFGFSFLSLCNNIT